MPFVINVIYCFKILRRKDGKFGKPGAVLQTARFSPMVGSSPPKQPGQNLLSSASISLLDRVLTGAGTGVMAKKKNPTALTNQNPKPTAVPGGDFISLVMGQRPGPTSMRRPPPPKDSVLGSQTATPILEFPGSSYLHKGCLGQD